MEAKLEKGQIVEVSDDGNRWKLRRFSQHYSRGIFAYDGIGNEEHDVYFELWRLPDSSPIEVVPPMEGWFIASNRILCGPYDSRQEATDWLESFSTKARVVLLREVIE